MSKGFQGGFTDGTYGYVAPQNISARHGEVVRLTLQGFSTMAVLDLTIKDAALKGLMGQELREREEGGGLSHQRVLRCQARHTTRLEWVCLSLVRQHSKGAHVSGIFTKKLTHVGGHPNMAPFA